MLCAGNYDNRPTRVWAEVSWSMIGLSYYKGNYDNRPTRVWEEVSWSMIGLSYYKYVTKLVKKIKLNTTRILRMLVVFNIIFFIRFVTLT